MLEWIYDNTAFVSMLTSIVTALIWLVYLQVIVTSTGRQRRALVSINRGSGKNLDAHLVLCNLGYETVYVTDVIAEVDVQGGHHAVNVTDCEDVEDSDPTKPMSGTLQGPLGHGDCRALGTVSDLLRRIAATTTFDYEAVEGVSVVVLAGRESSIGVHRRYRLVHEDGEMYLDADMMDTKKLSRSKSRRYRESWGYDVPKGYVDQRARPDTAAPVGAAV